MKKNIIIAALALVAIGLACNTIAQQATLRKQLRSIYEQRATIYTYRDIVREVANDRPDYFEDGLSEGDAYNSLTQSEMEMLWK